ncbi:MAG: WD40 repeat domain-containing protein, partial [Chloroflexota bacterium]
MLRSYGKHYGEGVQMKRLSAAVGSMFGSRRGRGLMAAWGVMIGIAVFFGWDVRREIANTNHGDMLAYVTQDYRLMLYDPRTHRKTELMTGVRDFRLSRDGQVAFTIHGNADTDIYVVDPSNESLSLNISQNPDEFNTPLAWSPDGRYFAYVTHVEQYSEQTLYVWD